MKKVKWTTKEIEFLKANYADRYNADLAKELGVTSFRISNKAYALKLKKSMAFKQKQAENMIGKSEQFRFKKGHTPKNKGRKGWCPSGCEKGWFKKGNVPHNYKNGEHLTKDGYIIKSIGEGKQRLKHLHNWEIANGPLPKGYCLSFKDGDKLNTSLDNLELLTRGELLRRNRLSDTCIAKKQLGVTSENDIETIKQIAPHVIEAKRNELLIREKLKK